MNLEQKVREVVARVFHVDQAELSESSSPNSIPRWDSFGQLELVDALQSAFGISIAPEDISKLQTLGCVENAVRNWTSATGSSTPPDTARR